MIALLLGLAAWAAAPDLVVRVEGLDSAGGVVICTLYDSETTWLQDPGFVATVQAAPADGSATCVFPAIPPGRYAVTFIHDLNNNGDMDTNLLGLPREPWGVSRDAPVRLGPPRFEDAAFLHPGARVLATAR